MFSNVSVNFGETESSLVDRDKSLVEGMLVTEKRKWHRCKMKLHGINISFGPVTTFKCSEYIEVKLKRHVIFSCCLVYWMNSDFELLNYIADRVCAGD